MKMLTIPIHVEDTPSDINTVVATSWELAIYPDFKVENYIIGRMLESIVNRVELNMAIDENKLVNKNIYYRCKYHYADRKPTEWTKFKVFTLTGEVLPNITSVIEMPKAESWVEYADIDNILTGTFHIKTSAFRDYSGNSTHHKTLCTVTNTIGSVLYTEEAIKTSALEVGNLYMFSIPVSTFEDQDMYTINITYVGSNGIHSGVLNHKYESYLVEDAVNHVSDYVTGNKITNVVSGRAAYFKIAPKTMQLQSINMHLKDAETDTIVTENLNQETIYPKLNIPTYVDTGKVYDIMTSLNLKDGGTTVPVKLISMTIADNDLRVIDVNATYKDQYSYMGSVTNPGLSTQSTEQLDDGHILIANTSTKSIDMYAIVNEELVFVKQAIKLPAYENVAMVNVNIIKMYNGKILVNYNADNKALLGQKLVFNLYDYNAGNLTFTLANQVKVNNFGDSTSYSSSLFAAPNGDVYFIPAISYTGNERTLLKMHKLDANTFQTSVVGSLPFDAIRHVSIVPTASKTKFLVLNGSENEFIVDGKTSWKRENNSVFEFDTGTHLYNDLSIDMSVLPQAMYNVQSYLRKDGKILIFNSSRSGTTVDDQNTALIDLDTKTVTLLNNDLPDNMIYRSTVVLNNGEFIRIVSNPEATHSVYRYVGDSLNTVVTPIVENRNADLIVPAGQTVEIDNMSNYGKIVIQGTSMENTGKLVSTDKGLPGEFYYNTLIISDDVVLDSSEYNHYERIIVINSADAKFMS